MKKILLIAGLVFLLSMSLVSADGSEFAESKQIINSKTSCDKLTSEQFETLGDYYMEQMHPGEAHELMHKMMGGENSEAVKQMHISMAKTIYCGEDSQGTSGMDMSSMMGSGGIGMMGMMSMMNMMGGGMMNLQNPQTNMMKNWCYYGNYGYWSFLNVLCIILLIGLIVLVYLWILKLWKDSYGKKK